MPGRLLLALALAGGGYFLWQEDRWQTVTGHLGAFAGANTPGAGQQPAGPPSPAPTTRVATWRDENGQVHFAQASSAPPQALAYQAGASGTMADYDRAVEADRGMAAGSLARAASSREQASAANAGPLNGAAVGTQVVADPQAGGEGAGLAVQQARQLLRQYDEALQSIRDENAR